MSDDNDVLDEILSDAPPVEPEEQEKPEADQQDRPRNPDGTFASKEADKTEDEQTVQEPDPEKPEGEKGNKVPVAALQAEREKARAIEARLEETQRQLQQVLGQVQLLSQQRPAQEPPREPAKPPDFWSDPDTFVKSAVSPIEEAVTRRLHGISRQMAVQEHGAEAVGGAFQALAAAMNTDPQAAFEYRRIMASDHPYGELVAWHKRVQTMQKIGGDPDAWLEAELQKRMADPDFQAKVIEAARGTARAGNGQGQPQVALPPSLNRVPGKGSDAAPGDMSSEGLFNYAMSG